MEILTLSKLHFLLIWGVHVNLPRWRSGQVACPLNRRATPRIASSKVSTPFCKIHINKLFELSCFICIGKSIESELLKIKAVEEKVQLFLVHRCHNQTTN